MVDTVIRAELPTEEENSSLREKVLKYNMHRESHLNSPDNRCNKDGKCVWGYPKPLQLATTLDNSGRVIYRRRKEEDRMVVPYMPCLTELMDCHVNVDVTSTVNIFRYLYKCLFKGLDTTKYTITNPNDHADEIKDYINARYLSASEATWRIFGFNISSMLPSVECLPVHLPGENIHQLGSSGTTSTASDLLRYFARPLDPEFRSLKYTDFYIHYVHYKYIEGSQLHADQWHERILPEINIRKIIAKRCRGEKPARINFISPHHGELFYLRTLLLYKPAYSYDDLRKIGNITYDTFQEAATRMGLFKNLADAELCLQETISYSYAPRKQKLFFCRGTPRFSWLSSPPESFPVHGKPMETYANSMATVATYQFFRFPSCLWDTLPHPLLTQLLL